MKRSKNANRFEAQARLRAFKSIEVKSIEAKAKINLPSLSSVSKTEQNRLVHLYQEYASTNPSTYLVGYDGYRFCRFGKRKGVSIHFSPNPKKGDEPFSYYKMSWRGDCLDWFQVSEKEMIDCVAFNMWEDCVPPCSQYIHYKREVLENGLLQETLEKWHELAIFQAVKNSQISDPPFLDKDTKVFVSCGISWFNSESGLCPVAYSLRK